MLWTITPITTFLENQTVNSKKNKPIIAALFLLSFATGSIASTAQETAIFKSQIPMAVEAQEFYESANEFNKRSARAGFDWNVTYTLLKESKELFDNGKYSKSIELSNRAKEYAILGLKQAEVSKIVRPLIN